jgi:phosphatidylinositol 4-kinase
MGGNYTAEPFIYFSDLTIKAFLAVRRFEEQIFNMINLMTYSGLKCFRKNSLVV